MSEIQTESEIRPTVDASLLEGSLAKLWERARHVSDLVLRLKEENRVLKERTSQLEGESKSLREAEQSFRHEQNQAHALLQSQLEANQRELAQLKQELLHAQTNGSEIFSKEEKEALKARMKELIARINSRL